MMRYSNYSSLLSDGCNLTLILKGEFLMCFSSLLTDTRCSPTSLGVKEMPVLPCKREEFIL